MKQRFTALLLVFALLVPLILPVSGQEADPEEPIVEALKVFFAGAEGDYGAVNPNDGGACSIGLLQWHGARALELLRYALENWPGTANYLSQALYREISAQGTSWSSRTLSASEAERVSALLGSQDGRAAQDALARRDILDYVSLCRGWGMATDATAAYFSVIVNQFGSGGAAEYLGHIRATLGVGEDAVFRDLNVLHQAVHDTKSYGQRYLAMRDKSYEYIVSLGWELSGPTPRALPEGADLLAEAREARPAAWQLSQEALDLLLRFRLLLQKNTGFPQALLNSPLPGKSPPFR